MRIWRGVWCMVAVLSSASPLSAQTWAERVHVSINGAVQTTSNDFTDRFDFESQLETGSTEVDYRIRSGFVFDGGVGYRLWKNLGVGVAVSVLSRENSGLTTSSFPHPLHFDQPREVTGEATALARKETAAHIQAMYLWNAGGALRVVFSGGPSFFNVQQDLVSEVTIDESYPFDMATFAEARQVREKGSAPAFNVGADVLWMLTPKVGVGGLVRFSRTTIDLDAPGGGTIPVDAGGVYAGGGVRFLF
jgi:Outer membrane protein beta-barrel domain